METSLIGSYQSKLHVVFGNWDANAISNGLGVLNWILNVISISPALKSAAEVKAIKILNKLPDYR